jgi:aspartyl/asparaginyl beta-hydroxylase (cupin superfamily)
LLTIKNKGFFFNTCFSREILIAPHYGVTNAKWRIHIPLSVNSDFVDSLFIKVDKEARKWNEKYFIIDDSFEHLVYLNPVLSAEKSERKRKVLLVDIWNQNLSDDEKKEIDFILKLLI